MNKIADPFTLIPPQIVNHWGMFLAMGVCLILLAVIASIGSARTSTRSVYLFGWLFICASAIEAVDAYMTGGWNGFYLHLVGAILFGVTGYMLVTYAKDNAEAATLIAAMYFIAAGCFNVVGPFAANVPDRAWHLLAGFITLILGPILLATWTNRNVQISRFRLIGMFIGIDLLFRGLALTIFALDLRNH